MNPHLRYAEQQHAEAAARLGYTVAFAQGGLQASVLINGGALIGLFTLIAPQRDLAAKLWTSGLAFSLALALTMVGWICATISQDRFQIASTKIAFNTEHEAAGVAPPHDTDATIKWGNRTLYLAYGSVIASVSVFIVGALLALHGLA